MNEILQANIFFFITAVSVVLLTIVLVILLWYVLGIAKNVRKISRRVQEEVDMVADDLDAARANIKDEGKKILSVWKVLANFFSKPEEQPKRKSTAKKKTTK
ncbi:MAG: hypothetical protein COU11_01900 [Candidatus Harrisonbacteria bacterium CG10_big_fil_rev_8_21_14_0_10_49_15]|uniref:DUF948 domain-containing protein n=1 Tax=Candidatus Harrisonbacteria bacterium CG10_big_fil_rev_8_21_14_0_10_49_15 TaxID=1974587 RepID=A0A2H0UL88_9BACT|nr:MAG: hypothetical protein COU11_01900 [Candidatus Harrisonbacteria bacterium CG10_big_fil_rev_8_21_14_0_10_49_15]